MLPLILRSNSVRRSGRGAVTSMQRRTQALRTLRAIESRPIRRSARAQNDNVLGGTACTTECHAQLRERIRKCNTT
jgi:hypothetical protein